MKRAALTALLIVIALVVSGCGIIRDPAAPDDGSVRTSSVSTVGTVGTATVTITIILPKGD